MNYKKAILSVGVLVVTAISGAFFINQLKIAQGENLVGQLGIEQKLSVPTAKDAILIDETGQKKAFGEFLKGRPVVMMLIFYSCRSACTTEFEGALKSFRGMRLKTIGKDYDVLTVSIHPKETPELARAKKAEFLSYYNRPQAGKVLTPEEQKLKTQVESGWRFLTGDHDEVQKLAKSMGFKYTFNEEKNRVIHPTGLILLTPGGKVSKYFLGTEYPTGYLQDSLVAAASGEIGAISEPVLIGCFEYDPATGTTKLHVMTAMKYLGTLTMILVAAMVVALFRGEKHNLKHEGPTV